MHATLLKMVARGFVATRLNFFPELRRLTHTTEQALYPSYWVSHSAEHTVLRQGETSDVRLVEHDRPVQTIPCAEQQSTMPPWNKGADMHPSPI